MLDSQDQVFRGMLARHFSKAYDAYLLINRVIDKRVARALGRDDPNFRLKNACPCCQYVLEDEDELEYDMLVSMDGGSSCKRFATAGSASVEHFPSDYFLPRTQVNAHARKTNNGEVLAGDACQPSSTFGSVCHGHFIYAAAGVVTFFIRTTTTPR